MKFKLVILTVLTLVLVSCNTTKKTSGQNANAQITNTTWELVELDGSKIDQTNIEGKKIQFTLNSTDQRVFGNSGCNNFNGSYNLEDGLRIKFSQIASTRMACPENEINEQEVLDVFNKTDNYTVNGNKLMLNIGKRAPLAVFKKVAPKDKIVEKYWKLKKLEGKEVTMANNQEKEIFFMLKANDNRLQGFAGCNSLSGSYKLEDAQRISFSYVATTMKSCPDVSVNEAEFLKVFEQANNYSINGDELTLNVGRRASLAVFEAVYF
ncbi:Heat shock protein HslJ [Salegentibacter echinorum]|uniref:Heat shock protein HslJ n=1 Tax=Salegentibacter echinorum TaxID=1073325 RepID=A0A1M5EH87_SALEC|nr:META domain-containing protein [Salegentibacter echinorum]SHF78618.1 Heat shock protein HslJ [Salegentibacter echinorum]